MLVSNNKALTNKRIIERGVFWLLVLIFSTSLYHFLALDLVFYGARDNINYFTAYNNTSSCWSYGCLERDYNNYKYYIGSSEPLFFLISKVYNSIGVSYFIFIFFLNCFFILSLAMLMGKFKINKYNIALLFFYFSFDFYIFSLFSELHRLKLAILMVLFCLFLGSKFFALCLSLFSHFQSTVFIPFFYRFNVSNIVFLLFFCSIFFVVFQDKIYSKLHYYNSSGGVYFYKTIIIFLFSLVITRFVFFLNIPKFYYFTGLGVCMASYLVGGQRLNFILIEMFFIYLLSSVNWKDLSCIKKSMLIILILLVNSYNFYKVVYQYNFLIKGSI